MNRKQRYIVLTGNAVILAVLVTAVFTFNQRKPEEQSVSKDVVWENDKTVSKTETENKNAAGDTDNTDQKDAVNSENETDVTELVTEKKPKDGVSSGIPESTPPGEEGTSDPGQSESLPIELPFVPYREK